MSIKKRIEKVIEKGGHVACDLNEDRAFSNFTLRLPKTLSSEIDVALVGVFGISKTSFILQAIQEKLKHG